MNGGAKLSVIDEILRVVLASIFLVAAIPKLASHPAKSVALPINRVRAVISLRVVGGIEIAIAAWVLLSPGSLAGAVSTAAFIAFVIFSRLNDDDDCACFGEPRIRSGQPQIMRRIMLNVIRIVGLTLSLALILGGHPGVLSALASAGISITLGVVFMMAAAARTLAQQGRQAPPSSSFSVSMTRRDLIRAGLVGFLLAGFPWARAFGSSPPSVEDIAQQAAETLDLEGKKKYCRWGRCVANCCNHAELCKGVCEDQYADCMRRAETEDERRACKNQWEQCDNRCENRLQNCLDECRERYG